MSRKVQNALIQSFRLKFVDYFSVIFWKLDKSENLFQKPNQNLTKTTRPWDKNHNASNKPRMCSHKRTNLSVRFEETDRSEKLIQKPIHGLNFRYEFQCEQSKRRPCAREWQASLPPLFHFTPKWQKPK